MSEHFGVIEQGQFILGFLFIAIIFMIDILCSESSKLAYPLNKKYHPILLTAIIPAIAIVFSFGYTTEFDVSEVVLNETYEYTYKTSGLFHKNSRNFDNARIFIKDLNVLI